VGSREGDGVEIFWRLGKWVEHRLLRGQIEVGESVWVVGEQWAFQPQLSFLNIFAPEQPGNSSGGLYLRPLLEHPRVVLVTRVTDILRIHHFECGRVNCHRSSYQYAEPLDLQCDI